MSNRTRKTFTLTGEIDGDQYSLIVGTSERCEYKEVILAITKDQWDALRFGFATAHDDSNKGETKTIPLVYFK